MKRASYLLVFSLLMLMLTAGCFRIDQELWHNADGTGKASFDVVILDEFLQLASGGQALPHLFEKFRQIHARGTADERGSGLGLAIVRQLVELHDGSLDVTSEPQRGSTFAVHLPSSTIERN